ncbi:helix-turn-helix domain-containing protein [Brevundimonas diminuta]|jgi:transcriptional regulator with XRE-family HTH domain|uniref:helix-turn-helix domain-containing protein n=1 Tax=Brevundimonas diminuta TaxID=293 RepID=UPI0035D945BD
MARRAADFDVAIGARLQAARIASSKTQSDIGNLLGVTFQQVQKYEKGVNRLPAAHYAALKQAVGFDPSDLLQADGNRPVSILDEFAALPGAIELAGAFVRLPAARRRILTTTSKVLLEELNFNSA